MRKNVTRSLFITAFSMVLFLMSSFAFSQTSGNLLTNGDLETYQPNFWSALSTESETYITWATDAVYGGNRSFKISKSAAATGAVGWVSDDNADLYWNNASTDVTYDISFYAITKDVNTSPATDDEKIQVIVTIMQGSTSNEVVIDVDQTTATTDTTKYSDVIAIAGDEVTSVTVKLQMGKDATGTVWFDNISVGTDPWSMGVFNGDAEIPLGWMSWASTGDVGIAELTDADNHTTDGTYSAVLIEEDDKADEMVFYSEPVEVKASTWYKFGCWIKTEEVNTSDSFYVSNIVPENVSNRLGLCFFFHRDPIATNWDLTGGDQFVYIDQIDSTKDWTHYTFLQKSPEDAAGVSIRARFNPFPTGTVWYDDFTVEEVSFGDNILTNGDLETYEPNFWSALSTESETYITWATDAVYGGNRSFKISKSAAATGAVGWVSDDNADLYWNNASTDVTYDISFYAITKDVNTSPATDDEKIQVIVTIMQGSTSNEVVIDVDQTTATTDTTKYSDVIAIAGDEVTSVTVKLQMGKDATGTVWFDNISVGTDPWSMGVFNGDAEIPLGWMSWASTGDVGIAELTDADNHTTDGTYSAVLIEEDDKADEMVFYSEPVAVDPDTWYRISGWVKTVDINTNDIYLPSGILATNISDRLGFCFFYHRDPIGTNWDLTGGDQFFYLDQRDSTSDWTEYWVLSKSESDAAGVSVRARFNPFPTGTVYYDDFKIEEVEVIITNIEEVPVTAGANAPKEYRLRQNYPNPFNPETMIEYEVMKKGHVKIDVYNVLGQKVKTLVDLERAPGKYLVKWDGTNLHGQNVASGTYVYTLKAENAVLTKKMTIIR